MKEYYIGKKKKKNKNSLVHEKNTAHGRTWTKRSWKGGTANQQTPKLTRGKRETNQQNPVNQPHRTSPQIARYQRSSTGSTIPTKALAALFTRKI